MNPIVENKILESIKIFNKHPLNTFSAIVTKLSALATMVRLVSFIESQIQSKSFFESKFKYCLLA